MTRIDYTLKRNISKIYGTAWIDNSAFHVKGEHALMKWLNSFGVDHLLPTPC